MWIIPKNLDVYRFVQDMGGLSLDSSELARMSAQSLMWRSKPSLARTWLQRWSRVSWMQHLSGRILRPSTQSYFITEYISLLPVIPASRSQSQESEKAQTTPDTFGRILSESLRQLDLFGSSEKMSADTLPLDSPRFIEAYEIWVTQLRQDFLVRQSVEIHTGGNGYLSWRSPAEQEPGVSVERLEGGIGHRMYDKKTGRLAQQGLTQQVNWPTPKTPTGGGQGQRQTPGGGIRKLEDALIINGLLDQDSPSTNGKSRGLWMTPESQNEQGSQVMNGKRYPRLGKQVKGKLNPDWVEQLMGLSVGWSDCDCSVTGSSPGRRKRRLDV